MYENFMAAYPRDSDDAPEPYSNSSLDGLLGFRELVELGAGASFGGGAVRVHAERDASRALGLIREGFPEFASVVLPIAKDWLGRQFTIRVVSSKGLVGQLIFFEPGSGSAYEIDGDLVNLFDVEFIANPVTYLESELFAEWKAQGGEVPSRDQCVGLRRPTFLGGTTSIDNLEISDEDVYWSLFGQLREAARG